MAFPEIKYQWDWDLQSSPEDLWPLVSDTNRFDRDAGLPRLTRLDANKRLGNARLKFRQRVYGIPLEYVIEPYEWVYLKNYGVRRHYTRGPLAHLNVQVSFTPLPSGGTRCTFRVGCIARSLPGWVGTPIQIGFLYRRNLERIFRSYDRMVASR